MVCHNTIKILPIQYHSMSLKKKNGCLSIKTFETKLSPSYLKNCQQNQ